MHSNGVPVAGPLSATRTRTPVSNWMKRAVTPCARAGYISAGDSSRLIDSRTRPSHQLDGAPAQSADQAEAKGDVRPAFVAAEVFFQRIRRPQERIRGTHRVNPFVRMPHALLVA